MQLHSSAHAAPRAPRAARQQQGSRQHACKIVCRASATSASSTTFGQQTPLTPEQVQKRQKQLQDLVQESVKIGLETGAWFCCGVAVGGCKAAEPESRRGHHSLDTTSSWLIVHVSGLELCKHVCYSSLLAQHTCRTAVDIPLKTHTSSSVHPMCCFPALSTPHRSQRFHQESSGSQCSCNAGSGANPAGAAGPPTDRAAQAV